jgi:hypothetical protein
MSFLSSLFSNDVANTNAINENINVVDQNKENITDKNKHISFLEKQIAELKASIVQKDKELTKLDKIKSIGSAYELRTIFIKEFYFWLLEMNNKYKSQTNMQDLANCSVFGSFVRQIFELPFAINKLFQDPGFADPRGRDIDFVMVAKKISFSSQTFKNVCTFMNIIYSELVRYLKLRAQVGNAIDLPIIGNYVLKEIRDVTITDYNIGPNPSPGKKALLNIPHYLLVFVHSTEHTKLDVDLMGWLPNTNDDISNTDFNINSFVLNKNGVSRAESTSNDFFSILDAIHRKEATCETDLEIYNQKAWTNTMTKQQRLPFLMQIMHFLTIRTKIIPAGYKIVSDKRMPFFTLFNGDEACDITGCDSPYLKLLLECGHYVSIMTYIGILKIDHDQFTQAIKCPYCREQLRLYFEKIAPSKSIRWLPVIPKQQNLFETEKEELEKFESQQLFSNQAIDYIKSLFNIQNEPELIQHVDYSEDDLNNDFVSTPNNDNNNHTKEDDNINWIPLSNRDKDNSPKLKIHPDPFDYISDDEFEVTHKATNSNELKLPSFDSEPQLQTQIQRNSKFKPQSGPSHFEYIQKNNTPEPIQRIPFDMTMFNINENGTVGANTNMAETSDIQKQKQKDDPGVWRKLRILKFDS